jgi:hypothetical protein
VPRQEYSRELKMAAIARSTPEKVWERQLVVAAPVLIGCDEFPVGYSLAGCPPAEPASASPTGDDSQQSTLPYNDFSANGNYPLNFVSHSKGALQLSAQPQVPVPLPYSARPHETFHRIMKGIPWCFRENLPVFCVPTYWSHLGRSAEGRKSRN